MTLPETSVLVLDPGPRNAEKVLVAKVLAGDRIAARELYDAHVTRVFRLAYRLCGEEEHARELVQESFIRVFSQLSRFRGDSALSTWVHRVTLSVVANARRRDRKHDREINFDSTDPIADEQVAAADPDLKEGIHAAISALPEIYRTTFIMHDMEGYTHTEIAAATGVAVGT